MLLGPIFSVEMVTSVRRARYFFIRVAYASILLVFLMIAYRDSTWRRGFAGIQQTANIAAQFFQSFAVLQILAVLFLGPAITAGTIATERERRTIEYLFATDLSNSEIVLGKLLARVLHIGYIMLVGLPILSIAMLMGGIAPNRLAITYVVTISTMVAVAVLSIGVSACSRRARDAVTRTYVLLFTAFVLPYVFLPLFVWSPPPAWLSAIFEPLYDANPIACLTTMVGRGGNLNVGPGWDRVWSLVGTQLSFAVVVGAASVWAVRRVHLNAAGKAPATPRRQASGRRSRQMGNHPMIWKESFAARPRTRLRRISRAVGLVIAAGAIIYAASQFPRTSSQDFLQFTIIPTIIITCGGLLLMGGRAAGLIAGEKDKDTWISLLSTPLLPHEIIQGKILGNLIAFWPLGLLLAIVLGLQVLKDPGYILPGAFTAGTVAVLAVYTSALGTLFSLKARTSTRALGATLATMVFAGGGYLFCCMLMLVGGGGGEGTQIILAPAVPFLLVYPSEAYLMATAYAAGFPHRESTVLATAYFVGNAGYGIAALVLYSTAVGGFGGLAGRLEPGWSMAPAGRPTFTGPRPESPR